MPAWLRHGPESRARGDEDGPAGRGPSLRDRRLAAAGRASDHQDHPHPSGGLIRSRPKRDAHRLETASEMEVLEEADDNLTEREGEQRVKEDPGRKQIDGVQEQVIRPRDRDPLVAVILYDAGDEQPEPREDDN